MSRLTKDEQLQDICQAFGIEVPKEDVEDFEALEIEEAERILRESKEFLLNGTLPVQAEYSTCADSGD
jgi:hypothetical protein